MNRSKGKPDSRTVAPSSRDVEQASPLPRPEFRHIIPYNVNFDFVGKRKFFMILSTTLNLLTVVLFFTWRFNLGTAFLGGTSMHLRFAEATTAADMRREIGAVDLPDLTVQDFGE